MSKTKLKKISESNDKNSRLHLQNQKLNAKKTPSNNINSVLGNQKNIVVGSTYKVQNTIPYKDSHKKRFYSLESFQNYIFGHAKHTDDFLQIWQALGYSHNPAKKYTTHKLHAQDKEKKLSIYGNGFAYKNDSGNIIDFLTNYRNHSFEGAYEYLAKIYSLEYEIRPYHARTTKPSVNPTKTDKKPLEPTKTDLEKETIQYFESRIYSEIGLDKDKAKDYFLPSLNDYLGIGIKYTDINGQPILYGTDSKEFERIRLTRPQGKKKYHSHSNSGYFPYITPLFHNQDLFQQNTLFCVEGEFKAFFAVDKLEIPCIGIGGIHLGVNTETRISRKGREYKNKYSSEFLPLTKQVIDKGSFTSYNLIFDADTFENEGKKKRSFVFSTAIERQIIAAKKVGIKEFVFTCINPNNSHHAKGLDDLGQYYKPSEIKEKLVSNSSHNDLFWHFRINIEQPIKDAFKGLKDAFIASSKVKTESQKIVTTGFIGDQLTKDINSPFVNSIISQKFTSLVAPTGLGKSYFIENVFVPFISQLGFVTIFCSPRNALTMQQASERKGVVFTEKTNQKAIDRLKKEVSCTKIVYSNYDNLDTAYTVLTEFHGKSVFIVIDESHLLTSDSTFRPTVIAKVCTTLERCNNNLFLTATPTEIKLSKRINLFEVVSTDKKPYARPTLVFAAKNKRLDCTLEHIQNSVQNGKRVLVHFNHLDSCKALKKELERQGITTRICASNGIDTDDSEFFESIQNNPKFSWNNSVKVILTTSVLEIGINLLTDCKTSLLYVNCANYGFDNNSYLQFIARIRNYTRFDVDNTIISQNFKSFLPSKELSIGFDFKDSIQNAISDVIHHNVQYKQRKAKYTKLERDRFISKVSQNVLFDDKTESFIINSQEIFTDYTNHTIAKGSPYFHNPSDVVFYEKGKIKDLQKAVESIQDEKEKAETAVFELFENDFYTLLKSVSKQTKDVKLQSKTNLKDNPNEAIQLNAYELLAAENLLKHHFQLSKAVKKLSPNDLECKAVKRITTCKESRTIRKTSDLAKRKKAYIIYFLLTATDTKYRVREAIQVTELKRIVSILEATQGKEIGIYELLELANENRKGKNIYNKKSFLELCQILFEFEVVHKYQGRKKLTFYSFENPKNWSEEMERLRT